ncbi:hypothetical protein THARTR1_06705 [Trichoderma harzianum]|uniref:Uncharacterized protein n=1 Tax=Trichoderma harzianum TaxID=5544 RepID=A0A2K0U523_TRIHA|nr:hypothetical protein THARTR1_06705 [Trichoderma harzianum]
MQRRRCKSKPSPARSGTVQSGVEDAEPQARPDQTREERPEGKGSERASD